VSSWTKLSAQHFTSTTQLALSRNARLLHIEGLVYAAGNLTDGFLPAAAMRIVTDDPDVLADVAALEEAGLWEVVDGGHMIVDFADDQMSAEDVRKLRDLSKVRQARSRQHRGGDHSGCDSRYCRMALSRVTNGVSHGTTERNETERNERSEGVSERSTSATERLGSPGLAPPPVALLRPDDFTFTMPGESS
jgi:hypothetical protein